MHENTNEAEHCNCIFTTGNKLSKDVGVLYLKLVQAVSSDHILKVLETVVIPNIEIIFISQRFN